MSPILRLRRDDASSLTTVLEMYGFISDLPKSREGSVSVRPRWLHS